ncbi:hypothetical protein [Acidovorax sp. NB1]|uniref:hypothetical protein n=1 Tax=Acidovorax sp. NB1 TaxID=1943571 RepID=UPI0010D1B3A5|nr:hypothetical protein [Acidovorax sp. NB1]GDY37692.1 hypothetical protein ACINB_35840 [Acidovorax sp. NB1]
MKTKWLDRRVAAPGPFLCLVLSQEECDAAMKACKLPATPYLASPRADATTHLLTNSKGASVAIVALGDTLGRSSIEIAGLLVHEAVHVWQEHCANIGERRCGSEQEAYGIQGIAQTLLEEYARRIA